MQADRLPLESPPANKKEHKGAIKATSVLQGKTLKRETHERETEWFEQISEPADIRRTAEQRETARCRRSCVSRLHDPYCQRV